MLNGNGLIKRGPWRRDHDRDQIVAWRHDHRSFKCSHEHSPNARQYSFNHSRSSTTAVAVLCWSLLVSLQETSALLSSRKFKIKKLFLLKPLWPYMVTGKPRSQKYGNGKMPKPSAVMLQCVPIHNSHYHQASSTLSQDGNKEQFSSSHCNTSHFNALVSVLNILLFYYIRLCN